MTPIKKKTSELTIPERVARIRRVRDELSSEARELDPLAHYEVVSAAAAPTGAFNNFGGNFQKGTRE